MNPNVEYDTKICPYCSNECRHPVIGWVNETEEKWQEFLNSDKYCSIVECIDENDCTIGYDVYCINNKNLDDGNSDMEEEN